MAGGGRVRPSSQGYDVEERQWGGILEVQAATDGALISLPAGYGCFCLKTNQCRLAILTWPVLCPLIPPVPGQTLSLPSLKGSRWYILQAMKDITNLSGINKNTLLWVDQFLYFYKPILSC